MANQSPAFADEKASLLQVLFDQPIPADTDDATTVRAYLAPLISRILDISAEEATVLSQRWKYSKGSDLKNYDERVFRKIFGAEEGIILKKAVAEDVKVKYYEDMRTKRPWMGPLADPKRDGLRTTVIIVCAVLGSMVPILILVLLATFLD